MSRRGALCAQRRYAQNPIIGYHQESELQLFPSTKQPMVLYKGGHKYKVAYILQREPVTTREKHPFEREWEEMVKEEHKKYPRTPDGGNLPEMMRKKFPDAYKSLSKEGAYWKEPKFVQLELNVVRSFKIGQRVTSEDVTDASHKKSLNRRLDQRLFLITCKNGVWQFPSLLRAQGESLYSTVLRGIKEDHKSSIEFHNLSMSPSGIVADEDGSSTCFFNLYYLTGLPKFPIQDSDDHAWVTRNELREYTFPSLEYKKAAYTACFDDYLPINLPINAN